MRKGRVLFFTCFFFITSCYYFMDDIYSVTSLRILIVEFSFFKVFVSLHRSLFLSSCFFVCGFCSLFVARSFPWTSGNPCLSAHLRLGH